MSLLKWDIVLIATVFICALCLGYLGGISTDNNPDIFYTYTVDRLVVKEIPGPVIHEQVFEVMVFPGVDENKVIRSLHLVSNVFGYTVVPYDPARWKTIDWDGFEGAPFPADNETFLVLVAPRGDLNNIEALAWIVPPYGKSTVLYEDDFSDMFLAAVIEHECTHNIEEYNKLDFFGQHIGEYERWLKDNRLGFYPFYYNGWQQTYTKSVIDERLIAQYA